MKTIVVLISESESYLPALIDNAASGDLEVGIAAVVSSHADAAGLTHAIDAGIPTHVLSSDEVIADGGDSGGFDVELAAIVASCSPDLVVLAGWTHALGEGFLDRSPGRVINLHPAMPGAFPGAQAVARAYEAYQRGEIKRTGVMVYQVMPEAEVGPLVTMEPVPVLPDDSVEDLEERVRLVEQNLIVAAVDLLLGET